MITEREFIGDNPNDKYVIFESNNFEYIDPIKYYQEIFIRTSVSMMKAAVFSTEQQIPKKYLEESILKRAIEDWLKEYNRIKEVNIPNSLTSLLLSQSKKEQLKLLKNSNLKSDEILAFGFFAWTNYQMAFSQFRFEHLQKGLEKKEMPFLYELQEDNSIHKIGKTSLTNGQLKQALEHRKILVAKFYGDDKVWHCFFHSYDSFFGNETWNNGQPHCHYISNKFGISRQSVIEQFKNRNYKLGSLPHVGLDKND